MQTLVEDDTQQLQKSFPKNHQPNIPTSAHAQSAKTKQKSPSLEYKQDGSHRGLRNKNSTGR